MAKVSNERKNLHRLAGEFLVASRLTQRGYMITLQWGNTISYDILAFDKEGNVAFLEVKSTASFARRWVLQKKYASPQDDSIPLKKRFVCCVDLTATTHEPVIYIFPVTVVAQGLRYYFHDRFPQSDSYHLSLDFYPQHTTEKQNSMTVGEYTQAETYRENYHILGIQPILM